MATASLPRGAVQGEKIPELRSIELFAGAGGLGMGFSNSGVRHEAVVEWSKHACETLRINKRFGVGPVSDWADVTEADVREFSFEPFVGLDLVTGGPPCQPFSMGGKHRGVLDERDMFPQAIRAIREVRPRAFVFENVKGLTRASFYNYFNYIHLQLEFPSLCIKPDEEWLSHLARLEQHKTGGGRSDYHVVARLVNAANYGVPQKRERVFFVGFREDIHRPWAFPEHTHSSDALLYDQWVSGIYWDRHKVAKRNRPECPLKSVKKIDALKSEGADCLASPWLTVRDAISDLPDPENSSSILIQSHKFQPGARSYPGHTGSPLDEPSKALKAGDHGVPGGENMLRRPNGAIRYFTVRECARIQTFSDDFIFEGSWGEVMRQLGNAVPVRLAQTIAERVCEQLRRF
ncbi:DNA cytosine methyltransferase [Pseudomonas syringae group genomosp. 7]|nr:DNA cytosine methyltransferase [Pseudomonas syringae group genomosp. 7]UNB64673.1 DNA cytosine methyltransferase [Pseudomonas syringae pv. helianthi]